MGYNVKKEEETKFLSKEDQIDHEEEQMKANLEKIVDQKQIVFQEYYIDSDLEIGSVSKLYLKQSRKIARQLDGGISKKKKEQ